MRKAKFSSFYNFSNSKEPIQLLILLNFQRPNINYAQLEMRNFLNYKNKIS